MKNLSRQILSTYGQAGQKWLADLPNIVERCTNLWQLHDLVTFDNLSWNYVAHGKQGKNAVVLKVSCDVPSLKTEINALKLFSPRSSVEVLGFDETLGAALLEKANPGKDLSNQTMDSFVAVAICCEVASRIQLRQKPVRYPFKRVENQLTNLDRVWGGIPRHLLLKARDLKKELILENTESHVIHGDLHRANILSHGNEWRAIDPKGYIGSLYNEVWPFIHEPQTEIPFAARTLGLDDSRLLKWCFVHSILSTTWCFEDGADPTNILRLAEKIAPLL